MAHTHESLEVNWSRLVTPRAVGLIFKPALDHFQHRESRLRSRHRTATADVAGPKWEHLSL